MTQIFYRTGDFTRADVDEQNRTVIVAFSSEQTVQRSFGLEILSHDTQDVDLSFLTSGRAPLLLEHDREEQIGVIERAWIDSDRVGRAVVRFSKNEDGEEVFQDVLDGIRTNISVGYTITGQRIEQDANGNNFVYVQWTPKEISVVSIPADQTVGIGRSDEVLESQDINKTESCSQPAEDVDSARHSATEVQTEPVGSPNKEVKETQDAEVNTLEQDAQRCAPNNKNKRENIMTIETQFDAERARTEGANVERTRAADIATLAAQHNAIDLGRDYIASGKTVAEFTRALLDKVGSAPAVSTSATIGLTDKEVKEFSLGRAVTALMTGDWSKAGFELECSRAAAEASGKFQTDKSIFIPQDFLSRADAPASAIKANAGLVGTEYRANSFLDVLYAQTAASRLGVQFNAGLVGDVKIPKQTSSAQGYWVQDGKDVTLSGLTFDSITMSPKVVGGAVPLTWQALKQSTPFLESLVQNHLRRVIALEIDRAVFGLGGAGAPVGLGAVTGLTVPTGSPTPLSYSALRALIVALEEQNALTDGAKFAFNPSVGNILSTTVQDTNTNGVYLRGTDGRVIGYDGVSSTLIGDNLYFGNFNDVLVGAWSGIELAVDESQGFLNGSKLIRALAGVDVAILRDESITGYKNIDLG